MIGGSLEFFANKGRWGAAALAVSGGALMALGQAPFSLPWLIFLGFPILCFLLKDAACLKRAAWIGICAGCGYFALSLFWIIEPFLVDVARHGWMAPFALIFMSAGLALFWMLAAMFAWKTPNRAIAFAAGLTLVEFARAHVLTGFPWAMVSYSWVETPIMQLVSIIGSHGLTLITLGAAALLSSLRPVQITAGIAIIGASWIYGAQRLSVEPNTPQSETIIRLIQPNAAQREKWQPEMQQVFYQRQLEYTAAPAPQKPDLILWPEVAVPFLMHDRPDLQEQIAATAGPDANVILGIRRIGAEGTWHNSLALLGTGGEILAEYDKHHLVPFGEYMPFADFFRSLGVSALAGQSLNGFSSGPGPQTISTAGIPAFTPLICYEAIFPGEIRAAERPEWLLHLTNDAWFGKFSGPYQHLAQARIRAIEMGLPLARSANTGVSAMIDPYGRITASLALGQAGFIDATLPAPLPPTLFARFGEWPSVLAALAIFGMCLFSTRRASAD